MERAARHGVTSAAGYKRRRPLEECHRPQTQIPQLLQADHGDQTQPESPEHNDRTRTACVRTHRLTLRLGKGLIPCPPPIRATTLSPMAWVLSFASIRAMGMLGL